MDIPVVRPGRIFLTGCSLTIATVNPRPGSAMLVPEVFCMKPRTIDACRLPASCLDSEITGSKRTLRRML